MRLEELLRRFQSLRFPAKDEQAHPDRALIVAARSSVEAAVVDDEFLADCIDLELKLIESNRPRHGLVPFFTMPDLGVRFAFGYWAPGSRAGAHEHTAWTITAVCRNELEVHTYDREDCYRRRELVPKNCFHAAAGRVGFIFEPCIHEPRNISSDWSLSFHVTSPRDGEKLDDYSEPLPALRSRPRPFSSRDKHPYGSVVAMRRRNSCIHQLARIVAKMNVRRAPDLLARCFELGSATTQNLVDRVQSRSRPGACSQGTQRMLVRTHEELSISHRHEGDMVVLQVETPNGLVEELTIDDIAGDAMAFVALEHTFEVRQIPGNLSDEERSAIAEALEQTGLFTAVRPGAQSRSGS